MLTGIASYSIATLAFLTISLLLFLAKQKSEVTNILLLACITSSIWAFGSAALLLGNTYFWLSAGVPTYYWFVIGILELLRIFCWGWFIHILLNQVRSQSQKKAFIRRKKTWFNRKAFLLFVLLATTLHTVFSLPITIGAWSHSSRLSALTIVWMAAPVAGLYLIEQLYVTTDTRRNSSARYLCIGLAAMFLFDFILFTDSLLFQVIRLDLWQSRGILYSLLVPLVGLSAAKNPNWSVDLHVSRQAVTTSATLFGIGIYLLTTAFIASLVRVFPFEVSSVIYITCIFLSMVALVVILSSKTLRAKLRVSVSKHFFNFKYDYRTEWLNFTRTLASDAVFSPNAIVKAFCDIVDSDSGILLGRTKSSDFRQLTNYGNADTYIHSTVEGASLEYFFQKTGWIIDIKEYRDKPSSYEELQLPKALLNSTNLWLIIPLPFQDQLEGFLVISKPTTQRTINWEDRDLLKTAGLQAGGLLAQQRVHDELKEASQFEAYSKLSAYIIHDIKNILGQQSLIVSNAPRHKHKPEFVDDVILTIDNSVTRMTSLLQQLREPNVRFDNTQINILIMLESLVSRYSSKEPIPTLQVNCKHELLIIASREKLDRVFGHIIQNAQEATPKTGSVVLTLDSGQTFAHIQITDTGSGMTDKFIEKKLFTAFESTKGLTGMGIGAFESREYVRTLGGDIIVNSSPDRGSSFLIKIPLSANPTSNDIV